MSWGEGPGHLVARPRGSELGPFLKAKFREMMRVWRKVLVWTLRNGEQLAFLLRSLGHAIKVVCVFLCWWVIFGAVQLWGLP